MNTLVSDILSAERSIRAATDCLREDSFGARLCARTAACSRRPIGGHPPDVACRIRRGTDLFVRSQTRFPCRTSTTSSYRCPLSAIAEWFAARVEIFESYHSRMSRRKSQDESFYLPAPVAIVTEKLAEIEDAYINARETMTQYDAFRQATWEVLDAEQFAQVDGFIHGKMDGLHVDTLGPDIGARFRNDIISKLEVQTRHSR